MSLAHVINDVFMVVFFLCGLEVKYELTVGELTNIRQALLPIMAAVGGVSGAHRHLPGVQRRRPANRGRLGAPNGNRDIAFALGILARRQPRAGRRKVPFHPAVADDIIAILVACHLLRLKPVAGWRCWPRAWCSRRAGCHEQGTCTRCFRICWWAPCCGTAYMSGVPPGVRLPQSRIAREPAHLRHLVRLKRIVPSRDPKSP